MPLSPHLVEAFIVRSAIPHEILLEIMIVHGVQPIRFPIEFVTCILFFEYSDAMIFKIIV